MRDCSETHRSFQSSNEFSKIQLEKSLARRRGSDRQPHAKWGHCMTICNGSISGTAESVMSCEGDSRACWSNQSPICSNSVAIWRSIPSEPAWWRFRRCLG